MSSTTNILQQKIQLARQEARLLYNEVETVRKTIQDTSLAQVSKLVIKIPPNNYLKLYNTLKGHQDKIACIRWSRDSNYILSACQDGFMIIWDPVTGLKRQAVSLENPWVLTCAYSPNGSLVASGGLDNACTVYQVNRDAPEDGPYADYNGADTFPMMGMFRHKTQTILKSHTAYISDCDFINDVNLVTASGDMTCCLWDVTRLVKIRDFVDHLGDVLCISTNPNISLTTSNLFVSGSSDGYVKLWDLRQKAPAQNFFVANSDVNCVKQFNDNNSFIAGSDDGLVRFFDLRADCEINRYSLKAYFQAKNTASQTYLGHNTNSLLMNSSSSTTSDLSLQSTYDTPGVISVEFSKSGRFIYSCYANYGCIVWDSLRNEIIGSIGSGAESHSNIINQVKVSPDGIGLCTASWDSTIKVWSV